MAFLSLPDWHALRAFCFRELRAALLNRFFHVFSAAALFAGFAPLFASNHSDETAPYFLIQVILYLFPLYALLIGTGSAQADQEERAFLFAQPAGRGASVLGKFIVLWLLIGFSALQLVLPAAAFGDGAMAPLALVCLDAVGAGGVFLAIGIAIGFSTTDRVKAHLCALSVWLIFLAGFDLCALAGAYFTSVQQTPTLWLSLLMVNPLDALRVGAIFSIDQVPFDAATAPVLARWWLSHLDLWFAVISTIWIGAALAWSGFRVHRTEA